MVGSDDRRDFFISHAGPDSEWAEWIAWELEDAGYTVELDVWEWSAGVDFVAAIERAVDRADRVIAVWSPVYFDRTWTRVESRVSFFRDRNIAGRLVPVVVEACDGQIPILYRTILKIDLTGLSEREARDELLEKVKRPNKPERPVMFPAARLGRPDRPAQESVFPGRLPPVWGPVPARNLLFTGRASLLKQVHGQFAGRVGQATVTALAGIGGTGKTQLAVEYAWRHAHDYEIVWWVDGETASGLTAGLADLAVHIGQKQGDIPTRARAALTELGRRHRWLLVYDNVTDLAYFARLLPPATGHLIVTCRDSRIRRVGVEVVEVEEFTRAEAVTLLRRHVPDLPEADGARLAEALADLPLAIDQAGAYLADTGITVETYLDLLSNQPQVALSEETLHHPSLATTVTTAYARLSNQDPPAAALLDQLAFLASTPIPLTAISSGGIGLPPALAVADPVSAHRIVAAIGRLALARRSGTSLHVHRLVQALLRARLSPHARTVALEHTQELLAAAYPGDPDEPSTWLAYLELTPHIQAIWGQIDHAGSKTFRRLIIASARYLENVGQANSANQLSREARERWSHYLGDDHPDRLAAAQRQAATLPSGHPEARGMEEDIFARRRRTLGDDHLDTLATANNLALALSGLGEHQAARELHEDTLARQRRLLGDDHPHTLRSANNLADRLADLGEHQAARELHEDTLARRTRTLGDDHPDTLRTKSSLARDLTDIGELERARNLGEATFSQLRRTLGDDHQDTLGSATNLAIILDMLGEHRKARQIASDVLTRRRRVLGDNQLDTQRSEDFLAQIDQRHPEHRDR